MPADLSSGKELPFLYIALPVMNESAWILNFLHNLENQCYQQFQLVVCVNQPDHWWKLSGKVDVCHDNLKTMEILRRWESGKAIIIDQCSVGNGWEGKKHGVGYARKTVMDYINGIAGPDHIIVSLDADTAFSDDYFLTLAENFRAHPEMVALAVPYYHHLTGEEMLDRAMLRYEIYMRHYFLNLKLIGSPYAFSALGSAMAVPVWAYRAIRGMTPKLSGEDFYFLQKLKKFGPVGLWNDELVYPAARYSDRVFFGTGPALIKGAAGDWSSYPIYPQHLFHEIREIYHMTERLFSETVPSQIIRFLAEVFHEPDPLQPLRENHREISRFVRAFHEKFDGLRILQFLKTHHQQSDENDVKNLADFLECYYPEEQTLIDSLSNNDISLQTSTSAKLQKIRDFLFRKEMELRAIAEPG